MAETSLPQAVAEIKGLLEQLTELVDRVGDASTLPHNRLEELYLIRGTQALKRTLEGVRDGLEAEVEHRGL